MALVTLAQAKAHVRVESSYPDEQLQPHIDAAEDAVQAYLNRKVYADSAALAAARAAYPAAVKGAATAYQSALSDAEAIEDEAEREATIVAAEATYRDALASAEQALHGIVANNSIIGAVLLTVGHLFAHRSGVVIGATSAELDLGVRDLLRPYRRVMGP